MNAIHLPFILNKRDEQFIIKKGTPLVQVITFKRESWICWSGFFREKFHNIKFKNFITFLFPFIPKGKKLSSSLTDLITKLFFSLEPSIYST